MNEALVQGRGRAAARVALAGLLALAIELLAPAPVGAQPAAPDAAQLALGARIYNEGRLASGEALVGTREGREPVVGAGAACANCHRPSGMGQVEGDLKVPPIASNFLFGKRGAQGITTMDPRVSKSFNLAHDPYTDDTVGRAVREGLSSEGRPLGVLMPRFRLGDAELAALVAYLRQLSAAWSPGVTPTQISLATVITPEVDAQRRKVFIDMMQTIVRQKNGSTMVADPNKARYHMVSAAEMVLGTERNWDLQVWELQGPPATWAAQLSEHYRAHPVFAVVSGLSDASWQPVQDFCDRDRVPCWFPSVAAGAAEPGQYTLYFSRGVRLEAALLGQDLAGLKVRPRRVIQVYRSGEVPGIGSRALTAALAQARITTVDRRIPGGAPAAVALREAVRAVRPGDALVFWLRPGDLKALEGIDPPRAESYFSGVLAQGEEAPIPASWRARAHLAYPYELPQARRKNLDSFHAWLNLRKIPLVDEPMQSEVFFSMSFLTDTLSEMLDNLYRDYLVERAEQMLSRREGSKAEQETRDHIALGHEGELLQRHGPMTMEASARIPLLSRDDTSPKSGGTTMYAHLSLAPGQRYASKSGYVVHFSREDGTELEAETPLLTP